MSIVVTMVTEPLLREYCGFNKINVETLDGESSQNGSKIRNLIMERQKEKNGCVIMISQTNYNICSLFSLKTRVIDMIEGI